MSVNASGMDFTHKCKHFPCHTSVILPTRSPFTLRSAPKICFWVNWVFTYLGWCLFTADKTLSQSHIWSTQTNNGSCSLWLGKRCRIKATCVYLYNCLLFLLPEELFTDLMNWTFYDKPWGIGLEALIFFVAEAKFGLPLSSSCIFRSLRRISRKFFGIN